MDRALRIHRLTLGDSHPVFAIELSNRGEILHELGKAQEALLTYHDADEIWLREFGPDSAQRAFSLTGAGIALTTLGRSREAEPLLQHALSIRKRVDPDAAGLAETEFALASAMWTNRPGSVNAVELARRALEDYRRVPATADSQSAIQTWLAQRHGSARATSASAKL